MIEVCFYVITTQATFTYNMLGQNETQSKSDKTIGMMILSQTCASQHCYNNSKPKFQTVKPHTVNKP